MSRRSWLAHTDGVKARGKKNKFGACYPCPDCQFGMREWKTNHVCFDCRTTVRRSGLNRWRKRRMSVVPSQPPKCPHCGGKMHSLAVRMRVPRKSDDREWKALKQLTLGT